MSLVIYSTKLFSNDSMNSFSEIIQLLLSVPSLTALLLWSYLSMMRYTEHRNMIHLIRPNSTQAKVQLEQARCFLGQHAKPCLQIYYFGNISSETELTARIYKDELCASGETVSVRAFRHLTRRKSPAFNFNCLVVLFNLNEI